MLRLLSSPIGLFLLQIATRWLTLYLQAWMLLIILLRLPPLTTKEVIKPTSNSLGWRQRLTSTINLIDWAEDHHDHHEAELIGCVATIDIIRESIHAKRNAEGLEHILLSAWRHSERRGGMHIREDSRPLNLISDPCTTF